MPDVFIKNVKGEAKYDKEGKVIRAPNRGYYDRAIYGENKLPIRINVGETYAVGSSSEEGVPVMPQWAFDRVTGKALKGEDEGTVSPVLLRAVREGIIQISGDSAATKRMNAALKPDDTGEKTPPLTPPAE